MQAKTMKRLAILIAVLGLIGGTGFIGQRLQVARLAKNVLAEADLAADKGDYAKAENLYWQHLEVFPNDVDVRIKYADAHLKVAKTFDRRSDALEIYGGILRRNPGRDDARRRLMELDLDMGRFPDARTELAILLKRAENDGDLNFKMGRCCDEARDDKEAVRFYRQAIQYGAPRPNEVYQRLATLLRDRLKQEEEADQTVAEMVRAEPENYKVYLARGKYLRSHPQPFEAKGSTDKRQGRLSEGPSARTR